MNINLISDNFSCQKESLKRERNKRRTEKLPNFETVYSLDGRVFVKLTRSSSNNEAIIIKTQSDITGFIDRFESNRN